MLQVFKRNDISAYIALLLVAFVCKIKYILNPQLFKAGTGTFDGLFFSMNRLHSIYAKMPSLYIFISLCAQVAFALFVNLVVIRQKLFTQKNYFTALSFILITSFFPSFNFISAAFISNIFLFTAFSLVLRLRSTPQPRKCCFNIGVLIAVAAFFYFPAIIFLLIFLLFTWLLRPFMLQELVACMLGFLTPVYLTLAIWYLNGHTASSLYKALTENLHLEVPLYVTKTVPAIIFISVSLILLIYSLYISNKNTLKNAIIVRKKWRIISVYLFFAVLCGVLSSRFPDTYFIIALTPFSILLSQSFHNRKEKMNIFTFFFLIISVLCVQWIFLK